MDCVGGGEFVASVWMGRSFSLQPIIMICSNKTASFLHRNLADCKFQAICLCTATTANYPLLSFPRAGNGKVKVFLLLDKVDRNSRCPALSTSVVQWKQEASDWRTSFESRSANKQTRTSMKKTGNTNGEGMERVSQCWAVKERACVCVIFVYLYFLSGTFMNIMF